MRKAQTPIANLAFDKNELILYMDLTEGAVADAESVRSHAQIIQAITDGQKHSVLIDASHNYVRLDDLDDDILKITYRNRIASAYFNPTLAIRLRLMQIKTLSKTPVEAFSSKKEAIDWLRVINQM